MKIIPHTQTCGAWKQYAMMDTTFLQLDEALAKFRSNFFSIKLPLKNTVGHLLFLKIGLNKLTPSFVFLFPTSFCFHIIQTV